MQQEINKVIHLMIAIAVTLGLLTLFSGFAKHTRIHEVLQSIAVIAGVVPIGLVQSVMVAGMEMTSLPLARHRPAFLHRRGMGYFTPTCAALPPDRATLENARKRKVILSRFRAQLIQDVKADFTEHIR